MTYLDFEKEIEQLDKNLDALKILMKAKVSRQ